MRAPTSKVVRFVVVGAMNTVFGYLVFVALAAAGCPNGIAVAAAMAFGVVFNFLSYGKVVFASLNLRRLPRFVAAYLFLYACNVLGLCTFGRFGLNIYAAQLALVFPLAVMAYLLNDRWVFRGN